MKKDTAILTKIGDIDSRELSEQALHTRLQNFLSCFIHIFSLESMDRVQNAQKIIVGIFTTQLASCMNSAELQHLNQLEEVILNIANKQQGAPTESAQVFHAKYPTLCKHAANPEFDIDRFQFMIQTKRRMLKGQLSKQDADVIIGKHLVNA